MSNPTSDFRSLSIAERIQLVEDIWDSIRSDAPDSVGLSPAQRAEVQRRVAAHDADPSTAIEWDVVRSELLQRDH
jgi:putative addiction module component (TIGR02574 family)